MSQHSPTSNEIDNKELINLVRERPTLYNTKLGDYRNNKLNNSLWKEVAKKMNCPAKQCKQKWVNTRNSYARYLRSQKRQKPTSSIKQYYLADSMAFLKPYMGERQRKEDKKMTYVPKESTQSYPIDVKNELLVDDEDQDNVTIVLGDLNSDFESENSESEMFLKTETEMSQYYNTEYPVQNGPSHYTSDQSMTIDTTPSTTIPCEQEHSFIDFAKSLVLDYSQLSVKRQRTFKQRVLTILNDLLDDQELEVN